VEKRYNKLGDKTVNKDEAHYPLAPDDLATVVTLSLGQLRQGNQ
jgi:hypothetical protein